MAVGCGGGGNSSIYSCPDGGGVGGVDANDGVYMVVLVETQPV